MLSNKAKFYDKKFVKVKPAYTTQTCSCCGYVMKGAEHLTLNDRDWICPECNTYHLRDHNSAINIMKKGLSA